MTAEPAEIAAYIQRRFADWPRDYSPMPLMRPDHAMFAPRPSALQLAAQLYRESEFLALELGDFLGTDRGKLITEALEMVSPPLYRADERLIVAALTEGAHLQAQGKRVGGGLTLIGLALLVWLARQASVLAT
jgi:hypothetical protein